MNIFDQMQSLHLTTRRKRCVPAPVFTILLDTEIHNDFEMSMEIDSEKSIAMKGFKCMITKQLDFQHLGLKRKNKTVSENKETRDENYEVIGIGGILSAQTVLENVNRESSKCHLCSIKTEGISQMYSMP